MQVILDSSFARPGSAPIWGGKKVEFRDWTRRELTRVRRGVGVGGGDREGENSLFPPLQSFFLAPILSAIFSPSTAT